MSVYKGENMISGGSVDTHFVRKPAWSQVVAISAANLAAGYEAPKDGIVVGWSEPATNRPFNVQINNSIVVASCQYASNRSTISTPINKGDIIKATVEPGWNNVSFVPFEDSTVSDVEVVTPELIRNLHDPDWANAVNITPAQLYAGYTAPKRGLLVGGGHVSTVTGAFNLQVNNVDVALSTAEPTTWFLPFYTQLNTGNIAKTTKQIESGYSIKFVPYKAQ